MNTTVNEAFVRLIDHLREHHGISNAFAGGEIGLKYDKVKNIKKGGSSAEQSHLDALLLRFPNELADLAKELGIESASSITPADHLQQLREELHEIREQLQRQVSENDDLKDEVERILEESRQLNSKLDNLIKYFQKNSKE